MPRTKEAQYLRSKRALFKCIVDFSILFSSSTLYILIELGSNKDLLLFAKAHEWSIMSIYMVFQPMLLILTQNRSHKLKSSVLGIIVFSGSSLLILISLNLMSLMEHENIETNIFKFILLFISLAYFIVTDILAHR